MNLPRLQAFLPMPTSRVQAREAVVLSSRKAKPSPRTEELFPGNNVVLFHRPFSTSPLHAEEENLVFNRRTAVSRNFQARGGNILPRLSTNEVQDGQAEVLSEIYGPLKSAAKELARDAGTCERSARNHLSGANAMNLTDFFNACRAIPELKAWGAKMMGMEADHDPMFQAELAAFVRAAQHRIGGAP